MDERRPTTTSNFGVSRRESHDSSGFYDRFSAPEVSDDNDVPSPEPVAEPFVCGDARSMDAIKDGSVALVVTSPPYFAGKQYEEELEREGVPSSYLEFLDLLRDVFAECARKLEPGGRIAVNVANLGRKPYRSLSADVIRILQDDLGLLLRGELIWQKGDGAAGNCAWGSFRSATNPVLRDLTERVVVASKGRFDRARSIKQREAAGLPHRSTLMTEDFMALTLDVWEIPTESARRVGHPAPFPVELPEQLIRLYTFENDLVLDPFMGSGSALVAAALPRPALRGLRPRPRVRGDRAPPGHRGPRATDRARERAGTGREGGAEARRRRARRRRLHDHRAQPPHPEIRCSGELRRHGCRWRSVVLRRSGREQVAPGRAAEDRHRLEGAGPRQRAADASGRGAVGAPHDASPAPAERGRHGAAIRRARRVLRRRRDAVRSRRRPSAVVRGGAAERTTRNRASGPPRTSSGGSTDVGRTAPPRDPPRGGRRHRCPHPLRLPAGAAARLRRATAGVRTQVPRDRRSHGAGRRRPLLRLRFQLGRAAPGRGRRLARPSVLDAELVRGDARGDAGPAGVGRRRRALGPDRRALRHPLRRVLRGEPDRRARPEQPAVHRPRGSRRTPPGRTSPRRSRSRAGSTAIAARSTRRSSSSPTGGSSSTPRSRTARTRSTR